MYNDIFDSNDIYQKDHIGNLKNKDVIAIYNLSLDIIRNFFMKKLRIANEVEKLNYFIKYKIEKEITPSNLELLEKYRKYFQIERNCGNINPNLPPLKNEDISSLLKKREEILGEFELNPQWNLNLGNNYWILKPGAKAKGKGIKLENDLQTIIENYKSNSENYVVQKYIENPLLQKYRKFDMRIWVLLANIQPLCA